MPTNLNGNFEVDFKNLMLEKFKERIEEQGEIVASAYGNAYLDSKIAAESFLLDTPGDGKISKTAPNIELVMPSSSEVNYICILQKGLHIIGTFDPIYQDYWWGGSPPTLQEKGAQVTTSTATEKVFLKYITKEPELVVNHDSSIFSGKYQVEEQSTSVAYAALEYFYTAQVPKAELIAHFWSISDTYIGYEVLKTHEGSMPTSSRMRRVFQVLPENNPSETIIQSYRLLNSSSVAPFPSEDYDEVVEPPGAGSVWVIESTQDYQDMLDFIDSEYPANENIKGFTVMVEVHSPPEAFEGYQLYQVDSSVVLAELEVSPAATFEHSGIIRITNLELEIGDEE